MIILPFLIGTLALSEIPPSLTTVTTNAGAQQHDRAVIEVINKNSIDDNNPQQQQQQQQRSSTENYLPRKLYPGTYKNYCGPTPEITVQDGCRAHGWHGDAAFDDVDAACQLHDISYCQCESEFMTRTSKTAQTKSLASLIALRFITLPALTRFDIIDRDYVTCINQADTELITRGIKLRQQNQQANCATNPTLGWFCQLDQRVGTLAAFEKINLNIFLKDLDFDESRASAVSVLPKGQRQQRVQTLSQLERKRQLDVKKNMKNGMTVGDAVQSKTIQDDEQEMLDYLQVKSTTQSLQ